MNILITGGAGFIGSSLANWLSSHHSVKVIDNLSYGHRTNINDSVDFIESDVNDDIRKHFSDIDVVFHFAAIAPLPDNQVNPSRSIRNNVEGTAAVLEHCRVSGVKHFVLASTSAIYENSHEDLLTENLPVDPDLIYANTKKFAEDLCRSFSSCYGIPFTVLRFFNVYGPHQDFQRQQPPLMGYVVRELMNDRVPTLHSDGEQKRDYIHVDDVCRLCETVMINEHAFQQTFNACSGESHSVNEIYRICADQMKKDIVPNYRIANRLWDSFGELFDGKYPISRDRIEKETNKASRGSFELAKNVLGWEPQVPFEAGIRRTVDDMMKILSDNV
jgi:nucleoside-diphosphate-sugar epimerase